MQREYRSSIQFTLNGRHLSLSREIVEQRLSGVVPEVIRKHAVHVNDTWFPVVQAFEAATGIPRAEFMSHTARRHLAALGLDVAGQVAPRSAPAPSPPSAPASQAADPDVSRTDPFEEWHTEANVQAALVTALAAEGWRILSVANTATKEHGVDVIASRDAQTVGVEVKGFPSRSYADPARAGEAKRTSPSTQAGHWYAQAVLAAMRLRGKEPTWRSVIALPDFPRYRELHSQTTGSLTAAEIEVWWLDQSGALYRG
ncbi:hypothetical protein [Terrabacter sp. Root181]|uniref:hypothetical protein n=1 Tax=Terrabacter sp. Root181 TaxID=1736484 RepID=UPI0006F39EAD|nr:hypothetical protein [Terrabacter sp. Root181]KRB46530.1 hypothetical protein ASD90_22625 [Terrabacter sp. Root181]